MRLSQHFTLDEFTLSQTAARRGIDNTPPPDVIENLRALAVFLEDVRENFHAPILISSGYRSCPLNLVVGGAAKSQHLFGLAADFTVPDYGPPLAVAKAIAASDLQFDQLIHEYGRWVHLGIAAPGQTPRREVLSIRSAAEGYIPGLR
jgi:hypothetical protein